MKRRPAFLAGDRVRVHGELATVLHDAGTNAVWLRLDNDPGVEGSYDINEVELEPILHVHPSDITTEDANRVIRTHGGVTYVDRDEALALARRLAEKHKDLLERLED